MHMRGVAGQPDATLAVTLGDGEMGGELALPGRRFDELAIAQRVEHGPACPG